MNISEWKNKAPVNFSGPLENIGRGLTKASHTLALLGASLTQRLTKTCVGATWHKICDPNKPDVSSSLWHRQSTLAQSVYHPLEPFLLPGFIFALNFIFFLSFEHFVIRTSLCFNLNSSIWTNRWHKGHVTHTFIIILGGKKQFRQLMRRLTKKCIFPELTH